MIKLYEFALSGHCHKIRMMLNLLDLPHEKIAVNGAANEHKSPDFLVMNPLGQVPVLEDDETILRDSHGILVYLAKRYGGTRWWPEDAKTAGQIASWLSTAANEVANGPGTLRLQQKFGRDIDQARATQTSEFILGIINNHLEERQWLVGDELSIADVAVYPYVALAPEGGVDLSVHRNICRWIMDIRAIPGYVDMPGMWTS